MDQVEILNGLLAESFDLPYKQEPSSQDVVEIRMEDIQSDYDLSEESDEEEERNKQYKETILEKDHNQMECTTGQGECTTVIKLETESDSEAITSLEENDTADQEPQENPKMTVPVGIHSKENKKNFHNGKRKPEEIFKSTGLDISKKNDVSEKEINNKQIQSVNVMEHIVLRNATQKNKSSNHSILLDPKRNVASPRVNQIKTFQIEGSTEENVSRQVGFGLNHNRCKQTTYNMFNNETNVTESPILNYGTSVPFSLLDNGKDGTNNQLKIGHENQQSVDPVLIHNTQNDLYFNNSKRKQMNTQLGMFEYISIDKEQRDVPKKEAAVNKQTQLLDVTRKKQSFALENDFYHNEMNNYANLLERNKDVDPLENLASPQLLEQNNGKEVFVLDNGTDSHENTAAPKKTDNLTPVAVEEYNQGKVNGANNIQGKLVPVTTNKGLIYCVVIPKNIELNQEIKDGLNPRTEKRNVQQCILVSSSEDEGGEEPENNKRKLATNSGSMVETVNFTGCSNNEQNNVLEKISHKGKQSKDINRIPSQLLGQNNQNTDNEKMRKISTKSKNIQKKEIHQMQTPHQSLTNESRQQMNLNINHGKEVLVWDNGTDSHKNKAGPKKTDILTPAAVGKYNQGKINGANNIQGKLVPVTTNKGLIYCVVIPKQSKHIKLNQEKKDGLNPWVEQINYRTEKNNVEQCILIGSSEDEGGEDPTENKKRKLATNSSSTVENVNFTGCNKTKQNNVMKKISHEGKQSKDINSISPQLLGQNNQIIDEKGKKTNSKHQSLTNKSVQQINLNINHGKEVLVWDNGTDSHKNKAAPNKTDIVTAVAEEKYNQGKVNRANNIQGKLVPVTTNKGLIYCVVIPKQSKHIKPNQEKEDGFNPRVEQINHRTEKKNLEQCILEGSSEDKDGEDPMENKKRKLAKNSSSMVEHVNFTGCSNNEQNVLENIRHEGKLSKDITRENRNSDNGKGNLQQNKHHSGEQENKLGEENGDFISRDNIYKDPFDCSSSDGDISDEDNLDIEFNNEDQERGVKEVLRSTKLPKFE